MSLTISIACFNNIDLTLQCLNYLKNNSVNFETIQFILTDNCSTDDTVARLAEFPIPNKLIIQNKENLGFGVAHNNALVSATRDYFLVLNNDLFLLDRGWDNKLLSLLKRYEKILVGLKGVNCTLRDDCTGYIGDRVDYIEGSFLAGKTSSFRTYGLFSPEIEMFVGEDSDLSLRYLQMGFDLKQLDTKFKHIEHPTLDLLNHDYKINIYKKNIELLSNRWSKYLKTRSFNNKILVIIPSLGIGDIICATPTIKAIKKNHPTAKIDIESRFPDVFKGNPHVNDVIIYNKSSKDKYDRIIKLEPDFSLETPLHKSFEKLAYTTLIDPVPDLYLSKEEIDEGKKLLSGCKSKIIVCSLLMKRVEWQGRNWILKHAEKFIELLRYKFPDYSVIEVGQGISSTKKSDLNLINKTSLRQLFAVIYCADFFVGIDSLPFHVAQAFRKESVILFGATKPESRVADFSFINPITARDIECKGCYHIKKQSVFNKCDRNDEACMTKLTPDEVVDEVKRIVKRRAFWNHS